MTVKRGVICDMAFQSANTHQNECCFTQPPTPDRALMNRIFLQNVVLKANTALKQISVVEHIGIQIFQKTN